MILSVDSLLLDSHFFFFKCSSKRIDSFGESPVSTWAVHAPLCSSSTQICLCLCLCSLDGGGHTAGGHPQVVSVLIYHS